MTHHPPVHVLALGTSGLELLEAPLRKAMREGGFDPVSVIVPGYDQWRAQLHAPDSNRPSNPPDVVLAILDGEDLLSGLLNDIARDVKVAAAQIRDGIWPDIVPTLDRGLRTHPTSEFIVTTVLHPPGDMLGSLACGSHSAWGQAIDSLNDKLADWADRNSRAHLLDLNELLMQHGLRTMRDGRLWSLARCRWSRAGLRLIAERATSVLRAIHNRQRKCLVLDLDHTLWGGAAGELGTSHIELGHEGIGLAYREFQTRLRRLKQTGVLLAIASKNDESTAWDVIDHHPDMVLRRADFVASRINWADKADNLRELAAELQIGLDAMVFVDDDPAQRERVRQALPQVAVPDWPGEVTDLPVFVDELMWRYFNRVRLGEQELHKTDQYHAQHQRRELREQSPSIEDWLASLQMTSRFICLHDAVLPRFAQLTQKTNQFNVTTRRYTEAQLAELIDHPDWIVLGADLSDRFGDSGIVGLAMAQRITPDVWRVDNFLLSCRVIGRTLEQSLLCELVKSARERGAKALEADYRPRGKNGIVKELWHELGFAPIYPPTSLDDSTRWRLDLATDTVAASPYIKLKPAPDSPARKESVTV